MKSLYLLVVYASILGLAVPMASGAPFEIKGPDVDPNDFRVTTFASGLDYPLGMQQLSDGSLLVAVSRGQSFWNSSGQLIRLVDADQDGVADGPGTVLAAGLPGSQSALRVAGELVFATGQNMPISVLRAGPTPADPLQLVGRFRIVLPAGRWLHPPSALEVRETPGRPDSYDLFFQLGSQTNNDPTTRTASLQSDFGLSGTLDGDSIYKVTITVRGEEVSASDLQQIATGLRNAAGMAIHPLTGDLYLQDNGIDGLGDPNEPFSADEINLIPASAIGGAIEDFGFPSSHIAYRTGRVVGGEGVQPLVAFHPLPDPMTGDESEGPADIVFAPSGFPDGLTGGMFVGFHGKFSLGGRSNEENPLVYLDLATHEYFHFVGVDESAIGHLDGLLATEDALFVADLTSSGNLNSGRGSGAIYMIKAQALEGSLQVPGDCSQDSKVDLTDGICVFTFLFQGTPARLPCGDGSREDAANVSLLDWDGDGGIDISDGVGLLGWLFSRGSPHPAFTDDDGDGRPDPVRIRGCP